MKKEFVGIKLLAAGKGVGAVTIKDYKRKTNDFAGSVSGRKAIKRKRLKNL